MFQSTIIVDPKSEIKGKHDMNTFIVEPTVTQGREVIEISQIRNLLIWCSKTAFAGKTKRVVIEKLHQGSVAVPDALLKLLEEPPADTQIILTIDRVESTLSTIRSRCATIKASEITPELLDQLGLRRIKSIASISAITWSEFSTKPAFDQRSWISAFIKGKKDSRALLQSWQEELVSTLKQEDQNNRQTIIKQLALVNEAGEAMNQNTLPRLVLNYLQIKISKI